MRLQLILTVFCALGSERLAAQPAAGTQPVEEGPDALFEAGVRAMERADWVAAEVLFREALEEAPNDRTRLNLAEALERQGELRAAKTEARVVADCDDLLLREAAVALLVRVDRALTEPRLEAPDVDRHDATGAALSPRAAARAEADRDPPRLLGGPAARRRNRRWLVIGFAAAASVLASVMAGLAIARRDDSPDGGAPRGRGSGPLTFRFP